VADVKPFICCRPWPEQAVEVAALPYDVFTRHEAAKEIAAHPQSFLRIDKTAALFPDEVNEYDERVYARAAELFAADRQAGVYLCEDKPCYFLYRLIKEGHAQTGIVAGIAIDDYQTGVLRRHENTRAFKLEDRVRHIAALHAQTGPVLVTYRARAEIDQAVRRVTARSEPLYDFVAPDGVQHTVWRVDDPETQRAIQAGFGALEALYIADGHHRAAAAVRIGARQPSETASGGATQGVTAQSEATQGEVVPEATSVLIVAFPSNQLSILDYNRVVFDTNGLSREALLERIATCFEVERMGDEPHQPQERGEFAMYLGGTWYRLVIHDGLRSDDPVDGLDVSLLHDYLLAPVLGIDDPRSSKRIAYVGGVRGLDELKRRADSYAVFQADNCSIPQADTHPLPSTNSAARSAHDGGVAFALFPCSFDELFAVADAGRLMPPKSTWFEPKPRSGLFIHEIEK
jgi:uncharacterized protein (DUF1015 family)